MGHDNYRKVLRQGLEGRPGIPIVDPEDPQGKRSTLLPRFVLAILADRASDENEPLAWPSVETLARETVMTERSIQRALRVLERSGLIEVVGYHKGGAKSRKYLLLLEQALEKIEAEGVTPMSPTGDTDVARGDTDVAKGDTDVARGDTDGTRTPNNHPQHPENASEQGGGGGGVGSHAPSKGSERGTTPLSEKEKRNQLGAFTDEVAREVFRASKKYFNFDNNNQPLLNAFSKKIRAGWTIDGLVERVTVKSWNGVNDPTKILANRLSKLPAKPDKPEQENIRQREIEEAERPERERRQKLEQELKVLFNRIRYTHLSGKNLDELEGDYESRFKQTNQLIRAEVESYAAKVEEVSLIHSLDDFLKWHRLTKLLSDDEAARPENIEQLVEQVHTCSVISGHGCLTEKFFGACRHSENREWWTKP